VSVRALHSAARRYCLERRAELQDELEARYQYFTASPADRPEKERAEAYRRWAGYTVVGTILRAIERTLPRDFATTDELRAHLVELAGTAQDSLSEGFPAEAAASAIAQERTRFVAYVASLTDREATSLPVLPSRRVLRPGERDGVIARIRKRWPSHQDIWHPGAVLTHQTDVLHAQAAWFDHEVPVQAFRLAIAGHGDSRLWQLAEGSPHWESEPSGPRADYELEPGLFWPDESETIWVPRDLDWLIYADHEESISFAGSWLVRQIRDLWPNWQQRRWTDHRYERPPSGGLTPEWEKPPRPA
jgi:hypothetical protein